MTEPAPRSRRQATPTRGGLAPWTEWPEVHKFVNKLWDPENTPHHSVVGLTGSGKTFLIVNGILKPMCADDRVLIIDCKRNDPLLSTVGKPVLELPAKTWNTRKREPFDSWFRLTAHDQFTSEGRGRAKLQVYKALHRVYNEGDWIIYCDEMQDLGGLRQPNLGLQSHLDEVYRKGRSRHVSIIASTQAPRHVPTSFYDQCSFFWCGRLADEDKQKRLREIGGLPKEAFGEIASLKQRHWLLSADSGQHFFTTTVKISKSKEAA